MVSRAAWLARGRVYLASAVLFAMSVPIEMYAYNRFYAGGQYEGLAANPHWVFLKSCISAYRGQDAIPLSENGPPSFQADFFTVAQRDPHRSAAPHSPKVRNVVVVVLESVGTQFLSTYGSTLPIASHLQAESNSAMVFNNVYSNAGYTLHSMLPLTLSIYPGAGFETYVTAHPHIAGTSPAQVLRERGYRTALMTGTILDFHGSRHFFENRGFDVVYAFEDFKKMGIGNPVSTWGMDDAPLFDELFKWISADPAKPFFLLAWTQQTHHPYALPPGQEPHPFIEVKDDHSRLLNLYLNDLRNLDEQLGRLFSFLRAKNLADSTLVVLTGDHGEAFGFPHRWRFHGTALYQESINVPCIFWNPVLFAAGSRSGAVGSHVDIYPTVFDILDIPAPGSWQGLSLFDPQRPQRAYFACNTGNLLQGIRAGSDKFIYNATLAREELYDLSRDPTEQQNLANSEPAKCEEYRNRLAAWLTFERNHLAGVVAAGEK